MNIKKILEMLNEFLSDYELAEIIDASQPTIWRIRTGVQADATWRVGCQIVALAKHLNLPIDDLDSDITQFVSKLKLKTSHLIANK